MSRTKRKKPKLPKKPRDLEIANMIAHPRKAGAHKDKKKEEKKSGRFYDVFEDH